MKIPFLKKSNRKMVKRPKLYRMSRSILDWGFFGLKIIVTVCLAVGLYHFFVVSDYFKVKQVLVQGELEHVDQEMILKVSQVKIGENIFTTNLFGIAQNVKKIPWINNVQVRRHLPSGLVVRVSEHKPLAVLMASEENEKHYYLMSQEGVLYKKVQAPDEKMPLITGFSKAGLEKFPSYFRGHLNQVFDFVKHYQLLAAQNVTLRQVHYDDTLGITAFVLVEDFQKMTKIYFGSNCDEKRIVLWNRMLQTMKYNKVFYSKVDLHVPGKAFARL